MTTRRKRNSTAAALGSNELVTGIDMVECSICNELAARPHTRFTRATGKLNLRNVILSVSEHFVTIPSLGALTEGHSLLVTCKHSTNILGNATSTLFEEIKGHLKHSLSLRENTNLELLCFEHGAIQCSSDQQLCSTIHGHLHMVPLTPRAISQVYQRLNGIALEHPTNASESNFDPYLIVFGLNASEGIKDCILKDAKLLPSQFMRQVIAEVLELDQWNWRDNPATTAFKQTLATFHKNKPALLASPQI